MPMRLMRKVGADINLLVYEIYDGLYKIIRPVFRKRFNVLIYFLFSPSFAILNP